MHILHTHICMHMHACVCICVWVCTYIYIYVKFCMIFENKIKWKIKLAGLSAMHMVHDMVLWLIPSWRISENHFKFVSLLRMTALALVSRITAKLRTSDIESSRHNFLQNHLNFQLYFQWKHHLPFTILTFAILEN